MFLLFVTIFVIKDFPSFDDKSLPVKSNSLKSFDKVKILLSLFEDEF